MHFSLLCFLSVQIINLLGAALENPVKQNEENTEQKVECCVVESIALSGDRELISSGIVLTTPQWQKFKELYCSSGLQKHAHKGWSYLKQVFFITLLSEATEQPFIILLCK